MKIEKLPPNKQFECIAQLYQATKKLWTWEIVLGRLFCSVHTPPSRKSSHVAFFATNNHLPVLDAGNAQNVGKVVARFMLTGSNECGMEVK